MPVTIDVSGIEKAIEEIAVSQKSDISLAIISAIISGIVVFALSEWARELLLAPLHRYKKIKEQIAFLLIQHIGSYTHPLDMAFCTTQKAVDPYIQAAEEIYSIAAQLHGFAEIVPKVHWGIPSPVDLKTASVYLMFLSRNIRCPVEEEDNSNNSKEHRVKDNDILVKDIRNILGLSVPKEKL